MSNEHTIESLKLFGLTRHSRKQVYQSASIQTMAIRNKRLYKPITEHTTQGYQSFNSRLNTYNAEEQGFILSG